MTLEMAGQLAASIPHHLPGLSASIPHLPGLQAGGGDRNAFATLSFLAFPFTRLYTKTANNVRTRKSYWYKH